MGLKIWGKMGIIAIKQDVMRIKLRDDTGYLPYRQFRKLS